MNRNDFEAWATKIQILITWKLLIKPIMTKFFQGIAIMNWPSWVVPQLLSTNPRWRTAAIFTIEFRKILISACVLEEHIFTKFGTNMEHHHAEMPTWRDEKTVPEVNSHDVISRTPGRNVDRSQRVNEIIEANLVHSSRNRQSAQRYFHKNELNPTIFGTQPCRKLRLSRVGVGPTADQDVIMFCGLLLAKRALRSTLRCWSRFSVCLSVGLSVCVSICKTVTRLSCL